MFKLLLMFVAGGLGITSAFYIQEKRYAKALLFAVLTVIALLALFLL